MARWTPSRMPAIWEGFVYTCLWGRLCSFNADNSKYDEMPIFSVSSSEQRYSVAPPTEDQMTRKSSFGSGGIHRSVITGFHGGPQPVEHLGSGKDTVRQRSIPCPVLDVRTSQKLRIGKDLG